MNHLKTLVLMQLKDEIDFKVFQNKKSLFRSLLISFIKFALITFLVYFALSLMTRFGVFYYSESPRVMILVLTICLGLSLISCTFELMKSLYFSEDNKVLITFPINANLIFISKIIVFYLHELKRSFSFLVPIIYACSILLFTNGCTNFFIFIWVLIPLLFIVLLPVLLGAILSIPLMYIYRFFKKFSIIEVIMLMALLFFGIFGIVKLIGLIPENIDLMNQWPTISKAIRNFLLSLETHLKIMSNLTRIVIGEEVNLTYYLSWWTLLKFFILIVIEGVLVIGVYFISRPIFFKMVSKNFETNKENEKERKNYKLNKYFTFVHKEFIINFRTIDISVNYLFIYILVPILILLLNALYKAMDTKELGNILIYTFNILLICLPMLASNSMVASYYSKEGRAAYIKRTKPIEVYFPIFAKICFNAIFSIPSVLVTVFIFGNSANFTYGEVMVLFFAILFLHYSHMIYSAMLDVMNPQNELYATTGVNFDNPNENKSTIFAFLMSFIYAIIAYKFISESSLYYGNYYVAFIKLLVISLVLFSSIAFLFCKRIKAYYYDDIGDRI